MVLNDCKKRHTILGMAWSDYKKAYDTILHSWILESLELVQVSENIVQFIRESMKNWNIVLTSFAENLTKVDIRRGIIHGDSLAPLLFVISMVPLIQILKKVESGHTLKKGEKLNPLFLRDDLKIFAKSEPSVNGLASNVRIFSKANHN